MNLSMSCFFHETASSFLSNLCAQHSTNPMTQNLLNPVHHMVKHFLSWQPSLQCPFLHKASVNNNQKIKKQIPSLPSNNAAFMILGPRPPHRIHIIFCLCSLLNLFSLLLERPFLYAFDSSLMGNTHRWYFPKCRQNPAAGKQDEFKQMMGSAFLYSHSMYLLRTFMSQVLFQGLGHTDEKEFVSS